MALWGMTSLKRRTDVNYMDLPTDTYQTTEFTTRAIDFIDRNKAAPFFVYLSYNAPHTPVNPPVSDQNLNTHIPAGATRSLAAAMTGVDREVGRLVDYLEAENLLENTIIYFFSDNGGPTSKNASLNDPYSGFKGDVL
jgi:arylsulfatase A-like enzyme